jgi:hypothetical protein
MTWLDARRKMLLIHVIDVPKLDELSEQIAKNGKKGTKNVTKYPRSALSIPIFFQNRFYEIFDNYILFKKNPCLYPLLCLDEIVEMRSEEPRRM